MKITALRRFSAGVTLLAMMSSASALAQQANKPNVVFILADNVGYGDLGSYGGGELRGAPTPRLDRLPARDCVSRSFSSSRPARPRAPRS